MKGLNIARLLGKLNIVLGDERGFGVVESLVAVAILGIGVTGAVIALATGAMTADSVDQESNLQSVAISQLAYTKSYPYDTTVPYSYPNVNVLDATYNPHPITIPGDYSIAVGVSPVLGALITDIQMITVTVSRGDKSLTVQDFKVNR